ncbi:MAG: hypothetical protein MPJ52_04405, partial [Alphaproteobacteria bacterium]|nr:hypothetical protein [Alphaproteobacteria bacterium]
MSFPSLNWRAVIALAVVVWGVAMAAPNIVPQNLRDAWPQWLPNRAVSLGLDLRGGSHLLLEVDFDPVIRERLETLLADIRIVLRRDELAYSTLDVVDDAVVIALGADADPEAVRAAIAEVAAGEFVVSASGSNLEVRFSDLALTEERRRILR